MDSKLLKEAILRVGEVSKIEGRKIIIKVDKNKNSSDLIFDGDIIKNVSVGSYIEIKKGFLSLIGKAEGEELTEEKKYGSKDEGQYTDTNKNSRLLTISLVGYIGFDNRFIGGIKELPLIGNEAFILTEQKIHAIHNLVKNNTSLCIKISQTDTEGVSIDLPVDGLFNSHLAIFGNTGSGKSNTLAALFQGLFEVMIGKPKFLENSRFLFFDFNGEYLSPDCITQNKTVYNLKTDDDSGDKIPVTFDELFDDETLAVLVEATEKTQKPFLKRTLRFFKSSKTKADFPAYLKKIVKNKTIEILRMAHQDTALKLFEYLEKILEIFVDAETVSNLRTDISFHSTRETFYLLEAGVITAYFNGTPDAIERTNLYLASNAITDESLSAIPVLTQFYIYLHLQLIDDLLKYRVQYDHIYPVINRINSKQISIERTFKIEENLDFWAAHNCVVVNLHDVSLDMRKTIPLLIAKNRYKSHKKERNTKSLNIIIDEAHNILSKTSFRETEDWKDYRLETFEEIIKEGRKFGVFLTISSQRPNDISETIISQAHNYFIHQLINEKDLLTIGNAVSYIDKISKESIPTLPVGTCIFSGIVTPMPLKLKITELPHANKPNSHTLKFKDLIRPSI